MTRTIRSGKKRICSAFLEPPTTPQIGSPGRRRASHVRSAQLIISDYWRTGQA